MSNLTLYYFKNCPYCQKVLKYLGNTDIEVELKNVKKNRSAFKELKQIGGKNQVPCLFINGDPLYESDEIIKWLKQNKKDH